MIRMETESTHDHRAIILQLSWSLAWGVPVVAFIVGVILAGMGAVEQWTPLGDDQFDVTYVAVWPAGLVLLAVGLLGVTAAAIATAVITTRPNPTR